MTQQNLEKRLAFMATCSNSTVKEHNWLSVASHMNILSAQCFFKNPAGACPTLNEPSLPSQHHACRIYSRFECPVIPAVKSLMLSDYNFMLPAVSLVPFLTAVPRERCLHNVSRRISTFSGRCCICLPFPRPACPQERPGMQPLMLLAGP
jgi:hypothetical protein